MMFEEKIRFKDGWSKICFLSDLVFVTSYDEFKFIKKLYYETKQNVFEFDDKVIMIINDVSVLGKGIFQRTKEDKKIFYIESGLVCIVNPKSDSFRPKLIYSSHNFSSSAVTISCNNNIIKVGVVLELNMNDLLKQSSLKEVKISDDNELLMKNSYGIFEKIEHFVNDYGDDEDRFDGGFDDDDYDSEEEEDYDEDNPLW